MLGTDVAQLKTFSGRMPTRFASAERATEEALRRQSAYFAAETFTCHLLDVIPHILLILNAQRQIVYANRALHSLLDTAPAEPPFGLRPGEVLDCVHARQAEGGCGTAENCSTCGAVLSILCAQAGRSEVRECRITRSWQGRLQAMDLRVEAVPLAYRGERFTVFSANDISHEKRRAALESIFFHDILNVAGSIKGFAELLRDYNPHDKEEIYAHIHGASERVIDEITAQRTMLAAEKGELRANVQPLRSREFLRQMLEFYRRHEVAEGRDLQLAPDAADLLLLSDRTLLGRVLGNMIKNALEASLHGEAVTLDCQQVGDRIEFRVHNPAVIPPTVRLQIFQRSFSTRGRSRGLGTYSMRLLSECLKGEVSFTSEPGEGTTFRAVYPLSFPGSTNG